MSNMYAFSKGTIYIYISYTTDIIIICFCKYNYFAYY